MSHRIAQKLNGGKKLLLATVGMLAVVVPLGVGVINVRAQSTPAPKFEVAAIRRCENADPEVRGGGGNSSPGRLNANCQSVRGFIQAAYLLFANGRVNPSASSTPIEGGPAWINSERYTINAKAEGDASVEMMQGPMLQALLEDRFKLKIRREARQIPVYALTAAKSGFKLHRLEDGSCTPRDPTKPLMPLEPGQKPRCGAAKGGRKGPNLTWEVQASLEELSKVLTISLDRPVVDKSGITGRFDFHLEFAIDDTTRKEAAAMPAAPSDDPAGPSIFTALQELGLKLEPTKGPGEFLVIDHVERPSEN